MYKQLFSELVHKYTSYSHVFTDGSIINGKKGCAIILEEQEILYKLPDSFSIFSCEAFAIDKAIELIINSKLNRAIIFTDSKSTLEALSNHENKNQRIQAIQKKLQHLTKNNNILALAWVPAHQGIPGNEKADSAAKRAITEGIDGTQEPNTIEDQKRFINNYIWNKWNNIWKNSSSLLHSVRHNVWEQQPANNNRKTQCILTRLRIGHSNLTHSHLMSKNDINKCLKCEADITIYHLLIECNNYQYERRAFSPNLRECLNDTEKVSAVMSFLKCIELYNRI